MLLCKILFKKCVLYYLNNIHFLLTLFQDSLPGFYMDSMEHAFLMTGTYDNINPEIANWPFPVSGTDMKRIYTYALERWGLLVKIFDKSTPSPHHFQFDSDAIDL